MAEKTLTPAEVEAFNSYMNRMPNKAAFEHLKKLKDGDHEAVAEAQKLADQEGIPLKVFIGVFERHLHQPTKWRSIQWQ